MTQTSEKLKEDNGTLPRFRDLMHSCRETMPKHFTALLKPMLDRAEDIMLSVAENAGTNAFKVKAMDSIQELKLRRLNIEQSFFENLLLGFKNFDLGQTDSTEPEEEEVDIERLALVEKDEDDVNVVVTTIVSNACHTFSEEIYAIIHRLAVINGGSKLGEQDLALPAGPRHLCHAFRRALDDLDIDKRIKVSLLESFNHDVISNAGPLYQEFNTMMARAGVLPNLKAGMMMPRPVASGMPGQPQDESPANDADADAAQQSGNMDADAITQHLNNMANLSGQTQAGNPAQHGDRRRNDDLLKHELFSSISQILNRRRGVRGAPAEQRVGSVPGQTELTEDITQNLATMVGEINKLQQANLSQLAQPNLDAPLAEVKTAFAQHLNAVSESVEKQAIGHADADIIDLVGMLFQMVLDDENLPDSVKALLSHLHTPYLKVALLDRKFFVRSDHPARTLLNALSQAGAQCNEGDNNAVRIIAKMRTVVNKVLKEFEQNMNLFTEVMEDFSNFMDSFQRRTAITEQRTVEAAKGRERLKSSRRTVSREIIERSVSHPVPKVIEAILLGPWANYLVITLLRAGEESQEWKTVLATTDAIIWSVEPKDSEEKRAELRQKLPGIMESVKAGLKLSGDMDVTNNELIRRLVACHKIVLGESSIKDTSGDEILETLAACNQSTAGKIVGAGDLAPGKTGVAAKTASGRDFEDELKQLISQEWADSLEEPVIGTAPKAEISGEHKQLIVKIKGLECGTFIDFLDRKRGISERGKLAWINTTTYSYMFVNHAGRQMAVKSIDILADEFERGDAKIVTIEKTPFVDRALKSIYSMLRKSDRAAESK